jgi:hypothetical protein
VAYGAVVLKESLPAHLRRAFSWRAASPLVRCANFGVAAASACCCHRVPATGVDVCAAGHVAVLRNA